MRAEREFRPRSLRSEDDFLRAGDPPMTASSAPAEAVEYEMGYGAAEFGKVLLGPFTGDRSDFNAVEIGLHRWLVTRVGSAFELEIEVRDEPPRKIGLFSLPVLKVNFRFDKSEPAERRQFFERFHQYFHKGGG